MLSSMEARFGICSHNHVAVAASLKFSNKKNSWNLENKFIEHPKEMKVGPMDLTKFLLQFSVVGKAFVLSECCQWKLKHVTISSW